MGYSRWDATSYASTSASLRSTRDTALSMGKSADAARREVFKQNSVKLAFDPKGVTLRESRDSELNPTSTPIILGVDVSGSMGFTAEKIAIDQFGTLVEGIIGRAPVTDPHIMIMAIGDVTGDQAPLQVTQFEADDRIVQQLKDIWLEGRGGANTYESYDLPWYFAAFRTSTDCFEKRGKRGYLFTMGDEMPPPARGLSADEINRTFGTSEQHGISQADMLKAAQEKYNVFHIIIEEGSFCRGRGSQTVANEWTKILGKKVILLRNSDYLSQVILSVIQINEGADPEEVINSWQDDDIKSAVRYAVSLAG